MITHIHAPLQRREQPVPLFGGHPLLTADDENGHAVILHAGQRHPDARKDLLHLAKRRLLVVERVEQSEHHADRRPDALQERRQAADDGLFHLIAGEPSRDVDLLQERVRVHPPFTREPGQQMHVEPVGSVHHGDRHPLPHRLRRHRQRERKNVTVTME
ncbi:MAG: hypothetical protein MUE68_07235 [Bacteroidetes bacterium]|nr:hypothetical protein [Bacteroidota bacterium]